MMAIASRKKGAQAKRTRGKWRQLLTSQSGTLRVMAIFLGLLLVAGGGSRADIISLVALRPLAFLVIAYALCLVDANGVRQVRVPLFLLSCFALLVALHLLPLPPSIWNGLPGRETLSDVYKAAVIDEPWLPFTPTPGRGLNSLFAFSVPFAALLLFALLDGEGRKRIYVVIWIAALASLLLGIAQLAGPANGPLYLYRITNNGLPVGFFANRNHQGLLIALGILLSSYLLAKALLRKRTSPLSITMYGGASLLFILFLLIVGSRAGLLIGTAMLLPSAFMVYRTLQAARRPDEPAIWRDRRFRGGMIGGVIAVIAIFVAAYAFSRSLAFDRLVGKEFEGDLRAEVLPVILQLVRSSFPFGSGFGSFEAVYMQAEPISLLSQSYLNHAHNDWVELILEGGLAAGIILGAFLLWYGNALVRIILAKPAKFDAEAVVAAMIVLACGIASIVDYPLRVPMISAIFVIACGQLAVRKQRS
jgi:O-antigen ligase